MNSSFKEKFDQYELIFTPILLIIIILLVYAFIPQVLYINNYIEIFIIPSLFGNVSGIGITILLDKYIKRISIETISAFIRLPTLILILISSISIILIPSDPYLALSLLGIGLGALLSIVCVTSFLTYYRSYYITKKK